MDFLRISGAVVAMLFHTTVVVSPEQQVDQAAWHLYGLGCDVLFLAWREDDRLVPGVLALMLLAD